MLPSCLAIILLGYHLHVSLEYNIAHEVNHVIFPSADLKEMCELLGTEQTVLERAFSYRTVEAKQEKVCTTLNVAQVRDIVTNLPCTSYANAYLPYLY